jgi:hypothetical protein
MTEFSTDLQYIKKSLDKNDIQHKELGDKIDNLSSTFQTRVGDKADQKEVKDMFVAMSDHIDDTYVTKDTFTPIQKIVYGMAGAILLAFLGGIFLLIFK